ncbi:metal ABC transporter solute-binding protein, Zn/Mn family [Ostreibacterium oceani]|uniref:Manganese transporter n=1 Tax=Ostreibacterium oceani TaxID=2654998 RepID=A0A6N7ES32_9GAMM|nr:zinc ABC transporter substrate-binding protein [Ostreibacterium oceani]MPV85351.1 manganese transporter [Ostreibacterium oceani]
MNSAKRSLSCACFALLLLLFSFAQADDARNQPQKLSATPHAASHAKPSKSKITVLTTTTMITDLVKQLGGQHVTVNGLMAPGVDPHLYKASARDVNKFQQADMIIYNGWHLEGKLTELLANMQRSGKTVVAIVDAIPPKDRIDSVDYPGNYDPHIWLSIDNWMAVTRFVSDQLIAYDTVNEAEYVRLRDRYLGELNQLKIRIQQQIDTLPIEKRILVTAHDAFQYFGRAHQFQVVGLQGINTASEASIKDVQRLADFIVAQNIPAIFIESAIPVRNIKALQAAVHARGGAVKIGGELYADSLGQPTATDINHNDNDNSNNNSNNANKANKANETNATPPDVGTYVGMYLHNVNTIVQALSMQLSMH